MKSRTAKTVVIREEKHVDSIQARLKYFVIPPATLLAPQVKALSTWVRREATIIRREQLDRAFFAISHGFDYEREPEQDDDTTEGAKVRKGK
ncbi:hypothetical protein HBA54_22605 [Pelagibius litoralis]|uniref:Uncharacterized protein n=1 Tax=Pelagibius litoralis TaxID=374515 RepID=A0A967F1V6_9PROT|nr:hypothetical protein [Pelagibius litoralis]NIA71391.1 hypothetical protein [Pelagibius litoralis]